MLEVSRLSERWAGSADRAGAQTGNTSSVISRSTLNPGQSPLP